jgi:hypothetical protein
MAKDYNMKIHNEICDKARKGVELEKIYAKNLGVNQVHETQCIVINGEYLNMFNVYCLRRHITPMKNLWHHTGLLWVGKLTADKKNPDGRNA